MQFDRTNDFFYEWKNAIGGFWLDKRFSSLLQIVVWYFGSSEIQNIILKFQDSFAFDTWYNLLERISNFHWKKLWENLTVIIMFWCVKFQFLLPAVFLYMKCALLSNWSLIIKIVRTRPPRSNFYFRDLLGVFFRIGLQLSKLSCLYWIFCALRMHLY